MELRAARASDAEVLYALRRRALKDYVSATWGWDEQWQVNYFQENFDASRGQVVCKGDTVVGFLEVEEEVIGYFLRVIEIDPDHQSEGIGSKLIADLLRKGDAEGRPVRLQVLKVNERARALYERMGFRVIGELATHWKMERPPAVVPEQY